MRHRRPGGSGRIDGGGTGTSRILTYPAHRRIRVTPLETRLSVLGQLALELRAMQADEQRCGAFTPRLSRCLEWLDIAASWECPRYEATA